MRASPSECRLAESPRDPPRRPCLYMARRRCGRRERREYACEVDLARRCTRSLASHSASGANVVVACSNFAPSATAGNGVESPSAPPRASSALLSSGIDEERVDVVEEVVAGCPLYRQLRRASPGSRIFSTQNALRARSLRRRGSAPGRRVVDVIDSESVHEPLVDEREHDSVSFREDRLVLDSDAGEIVNVEEAAVAACIRVDVEVLRAPARIDQRGLSSLRRMWLGTMSRITSSPEAQSRRSSSSPPSPRRCGSGRRRRSRARSRVRPAG